MNYLRALASASSTALRSSSIVTGFNSTACARAAAIRSGVSRGLKPVRISTGRSGRSVCTASASRSPAMLGVV